MGLILLFVGIAGLFLPVTPGVATIIAALAILRKDIPLAERIWQRWVIPLHQRSTAVVTGLPRTTYTAPPTQSLKEGTMEKPWYFIQLSDTHIVADYTPGVTWRQYLCNPQPR